MSKEDKNFYKSGNKKFDEGDFQGAIDDYSKAILLNPDKSSHYLERADLRFYLKDYQGVIDDYSKLIELNPDESSHYLKRADRRFYLEDYQGAIYDYSKAIDLIPNKSDKKKVLELRSKVYKILSKIDLDRSQSL